MGCVFTSLLVNVQIPLTSKMIVLFYSNFKFLGKMENVKSNIPSTLYYSPFIQCYQSGTHLETLPIAKVSTVTLNNANDFMYHSLWQGILHDVTQKMALKLILNGLTTECFKHQPQQTVTQWKTDISPLTSVCTIIQALVRPTLPSVPKSWRPFFRSLWA